LTNLVAPCLWSWRPTSAFDLCLIQFWRPFNQPFVRFGMRLVEDYLGSSMDGLGRSRCSPHQRPEVVQRHWLPAGSITDVQAVCDP